MTALGSVPVNPDAALVDCVPSASGRSGHQRWVKRRENVKDRQNRQCLFCGRRSGQRLELEIHHVQKQEHGGSDAFRNVLAACHACHRLIHNAERRMPLAARLSLALQVLRPESVLTTWICRMLFRGLLKATGATTFHPAALVLRPLRTAPKGPGLVAREGAA